MDGSIVSRLAVSSGVQRLKVTANTIEGNREGPFASIITDFNVEETVLQITSVESDREDDAIDIIDI